MTTIDKSKLEDMMRKINALLARADHPNTPEAEAESARAMAERLMVKYRIDEEELMASGALDMEATRPGHTTIDVCMYASPYLNQYWSLAFWAATHTGCRINSLWRTSPDDSVWLQAVIVGYEADIRYATTLFTNARIIFGDRMEPKVDPTMSDEDNVYRLRSAGIERIKIARIMGWGSTGSATAKVTRLYKRACEARGEAAVLTGRSNSVSAYKDGYASGFLTEFSTRLRLARSAASDVTSGRELVLANRQERVDEEFYRMYPDKRPDNKPVKSSGRRTRGVTKAEMNRYLRSTTGAGAIGQAAGRQAATEVDLGSRSRKGVE